MKVPWLEENECVVGRHHEPARAGQHADWPGWLPENVRDSIQQTGISQPWLHQVQAAEAAWSGRHVVISTPTASGKSLAYLMPILAATVPDPADVTPAVAGTDTRSRLGIGRHAALYIAPTKALAHDQLVNATTLAPPRWAAMTLDGDAEVNQRAFVRDHASFILTNPDMLHYSILPNHEYWAQVLGSIRFVVIDEMHRYRGVFGAHVASVMRRLRRICAHYGAHPVFILASATARNAGITGAALIGEDDALEDVSVDTANHPAKDFYLWQPKSSTAVDASALMARLVDSGAQVVTFVASRTQAELISVRAAEQAHEPSQIVGYRSGYLAHERRQIEAGLRSGTFKGIASTNALELGIDISGLDAVVIAGFPGTLGAFWQQAGRAGRSNDGTVILIAKDDPLDAHLLNHPELIFSAQVEQTVVHPANPYVLAPHLAAAAQELPLTDEDERWFGSTMPLLATQLTDQGLLRRRRAGWFWARAESASAAINLRGASSAPIQIIDESTGAIIGTVDHTAGDRTVHEGAIYLHQGQQWLIRNYTPDDRIATAKAVTMPYYTQTLGTSDIRILSTHGSQPCGRVTVNWGDIEMASQVTGYLRRDTETNEAWDQTPLDLAVHTMRTQSMWWNLAPIRDELALTDSELGAAIHALEHTAIGLLPIFAPCDRWDIGGLSTVLHPDTLAATIFVHDGTPGGAGFARRGFEIAAQWLAATRERLATCRCDDGCPACIVSPKCGNANQMLHKHAALLVADAISV